MVSKKTVLFPLRKKTLSTILEGLTNRFVIKMVDTTQGTKELAKKLTFGGVGFDVTTDDDVFFFSNNKEDAEKKRAASIARAKEDPKAQSLRR